MLLSTAIPALSTLTVAVVFGVVVGNVPKIPEAVRPGLTWVSRTFLRLGVVLLGLQLGIGQVLGLGPGTLAVVVITVAVTFAGTWWVGRALGLSRGLSILVATGFSICGASAIAAMEGAVRRDDEDVATSVAMVTLFGSLSMLVLPLLGTGLGLSAVDQGRIAGGSVHEVAQVVAAASPAGTVAVSIAIVVKLSRVVLLAPLVTMISLRERRATATHGNRPPLIPLFVVGFLAAMALRSTGLVPGFVLDTAEQAASLSLTAALFALGSAVRLPLLLRTGPKALLLGLVSTALITATTITGTLLVS